MPPRKGTKPSAGVSQSVVKYCTECERDIKHYSKSGNCRPCSQNKAITLQNCNKHGVTKFHGSNCRSCQNENTVTIKHCDTHGDTKFQGSKCCKCELGSHRFSKAWCDSCAGETTHQMGTCMACNRGGFLKGQYANRKVCALQDFDGCKVEFMPNSGAQKFCENDHHDECSSCGVYYTLFRQLRSDLYVKGVGLCIPCYGEFVSANVRAGAGNRNFGNPVDCLLEHFDLLSISSCESPFIKTSARQSMCLGRYYILCPQCAEEPVVFNSARIADLVSGNICCRKCSYEKRAVLDYCENCETVCLHSSISKVCLTCTQQSSYSTKLCLTCDVETTHKGNTCITCALPRPEKALCYACRAETKQSSRGIGGKQVDGVVDDCRIAFEYDGWYYHKDRVAKDLAATEKLLSLGYKVIRVLECDGNKVLGPLPLQDDKLKQYNYDAKVSIVADLVSQIKKELAL